MKRNKSPKLLITEIKTRKYPKIKLEKLKLNLNKTPNYLAVPSFA